MIRRIAALLLVLLALLGAGVWIGPRLVNWESWRGRLAELASSRLGRPVMLDGPITLALLPQPRIEASAVSIGPAGDGVTVTARAMRVRLALGALLAGRLEPREIALVGGEIRLPWPPARLPSFRPPPWLTTLDARLEDCRLLVGGLRLDGLDAHLVTGGVTEALKAEGRFAWRGYAVRFSGQLGRAGFDGVAPLDLTMAVAGSTLSARGVLSPGSGFEGRMDVAGSDLAALLPAPAGPFRASGRLTATADLLAADGLALEFGGKPARGAITLRLAPAPRLDVALSAGRLDLDAWFAALRQSRGRGMPVSVDLSAEATSFGPVPLRRLRGAFFLEGERLMLSDVSALLPGETEIELAGATAGPRFELAVRFSGRNLRETVAALGLPLTGTDPARLRTGEGRFKLALQDNQAEISDLNATVDGSRLSGAGVLRMGARPAIGLGLTMDRLDLDGLVPAQPDWAQIGSTLAGFDLNLRLAVEHLGWRGLAAQRATLDMTLEKGRLALRRLALRLDDLELALSGSVALGGAPPRFSDLNLEASGTSGPALLALLPAEWTTLTPFVAQPIALRLSGGGTPEALALKAEGDIGELRLEASGTLDVRQPRGSGTLTLRHPGAPRLLGPLLGPDVADWLGAGSFSLIANLNGNVQNGGGTVTAEHLDLVAGGLRSRGQLSLALGGARPRLSGRIAAEHLPLPNPALQPAEPLPLGRLSALDAELLLEAQRMEPLGGPVFEQVSGRLHLADGTLRLEEMQAKLDGGTLRADLVLEGTASPPRLSLQGQFTDATIGGPLFRLPFDLGAGRGDASAKLQATGHSLAAMLATVSGSLDFTVKDGVLVGFDLTALQTAAGLPELTPAETGLRRAFSGGATAFERLQARMTLAEGHATLTEAKLTTEGGGTATATGEIDLGRRALDLRIAARPVADAPEVGLRVTGPAASPQRVLELAPFLRWRAER
ncbi:MAG: AsmA-like C-terminal region-containing protein [Acetobacteraceae bacterium]|nr:AsmA-like C-terminal region-containing protein [Acetobacteraceae bacterium]